MRKADKTDVIISNFLSIPLEFFEDLVKNIVSSTVEFTKEKDNFIVRNISIKMATLLINKLNGLRIGKAILNAALPVDPGIIIPEISLMQSLYISSMFDKVYASWSHQIVSKFEINESEDLSKTQLAKSFESPCKNSSQTAPTNVLKITSSEFYQCSIPNIDMSEKQSSYHKMNESSLKAHSRSRSKSLSHEEQSRSRSISIKTKSRLRPSTHNKSISKLLSRKRRSRSKSLSRYRKSISTSRIRCSRSTSLSKNKRCRSSSRKRRSRSSSRKRCSRSNSLSKNRKSRSTSRKRRSRSKSLARNRMSRSTSRKRRSRSKSLSKKRMSRSTSRKRRSRPKSLARNRMSISTSRKRRSRSKSMATNRMSRSASRKRQSRSKSLSRNIMSRSTSRKRLSRSISMSRNSMSSSTPRKRKSRAKFLSKNRRSRSISRERTSRSKSLSRNRVSRSTSKERRSRSKSLPRNRISRSTSMERMRSSSSFSNQKRPLSVHKSPSPASKRRKYSESPSLHLQGSLSSLYPNLEIQTELRNQLGSKLFAEYNEALQKLLHSFERQCEIYKDVPEIHPQYNEYYDDFIAMYLAQCNDENESLKIKLWAEFWQSKFDRINIEFWKTKQKTLTDEFLKRASKQRNQAGSVAGAKVPCSSFSMDEGLLCLEKLCDHLSYLGTALKHMLTSCRNLGTNTKEGFKIFAEDENVALLKIVFDKLKVMRSTAVGNILSLICQGANFIPKLLREAQKGPTNVDVVHVPIDVNAVAEASLGQNTPFIIELIEAALVYEGIQKPSNEMVNDLFRRVCTIHYELTSKS